MRHYLPVLFSALLVCGCDSTREPSAAETVAPPPKPAQPVAVTPPAPVAPAPAATPAPAPAPTPEPATVAAPAAQPVVAPPPAGPPATLARAGTGEPHWLSTAGWKSGPVEHGNPAQVRVLAEADGAGARAIEVSVTGGTKDKAVVFHPLVKEDLAAHPALALTVSNKGERPVQLAVALKTGKGWLYHESTVCVIPAKTDAPIPLSYDLEATVFRTLATKWQPTSAIADLGDLKEVQIVILNGTQAGTVVIADVQLIEQVAK